MIELTPDGILILIPVFNDWEAVAMLLGQLDKAAEGSGFRPEIVLVDDGSTQPVSNDLLGLSYQNIASVDILSLRRNLGHQRALAVGLCYIETQRHCRAVVVMDGDGEDAAMDVPKLLQKFEQGEGRKAVFAERIKRSEIWWFRLGYAAYRMLHPALTGIAVRVGNFCVLPYPFLSRLVVTPELWSHFAASAFKIRLPYVTVPLARGRRLKGFPQMSFVSLVTHGTDAIFVFADRVGVRLLIVAAALAAVAGSGWLGIVLLQLLGVTLPDWTAWTPVLLVLVAQFIVLLLVFAVVMLGSRERFGFLPSRDHVHFIAGVRRLYRRHE